MSQYGFRDDSEQHSPATPFKLISAASTNATLVNAGVTVLTGYYLSSVATDPNYIKLYDKATTPTVGTDVPKWTIMIPAGSAANIQFIHPLQFLLGLGIAITFDVDDSDTTDVGVNEIVVNLAYI